MYRFWFPSLSLVFSPFSFIIYTIQKKPEETVQPLGHLLVEEQLAMVPLIIMSSLLEIITTAAIYFCLICELIISFNFYSFLFLASLPRLFLTTTAKKVTNKYQHNHAFQANSKYLW
jgi:prolipoprotein diacylglyceryltransferase